MLHATHELQREQVAKLHVQYGGVRVYGVTQSRVSARHPDFERSEDVFESVATFAGDWRRMAGARGRPMS